MLSVFPGDSIRVREHVKDYDDLSPDDDVCKTDTTLPAANLPAFDFATLQNLNQSHEVFWVSPSDGGCVTFTLKKVGLVL
ncbi:hypothetical protein GT755_30305 [Herbidospora sp. NEAU-GS84]|uniref:Uncharacterized protein n=1 Tax=Herbidospora solisilvae TaxID=2696284 RepID=A0A7C9P294_9ACTN|nr:hypothetical protein [Herbidospora solisilvae]NAS25957.1 hypothetical protein [Herbidospora solisilvae]